MGGGFYESWVRRKGWGEVGVYSGRRGGKKEFAVIGDDKDLYFGGEVYR